MSKLDVRCGHCGAHVSVESNMRSYFSFCPHCGNRISRPGNGSGGGGCAIVVIVVLAGLFMFGFFSTGGSDSGSTAQSQDDGPIVGRRWPYIIKINGVETTVPYSQDGSVRINCTGFPDGPGVSYISVGDVLPTSNAGASAALMFNDPPQVVSVDLYSSGNKHWSWYRPQVFPRKRSTPGSPGDAAVRRSANTYRITGNIALCTRAPATPCDTAGSPVPFEFDVTC